MKNHTKVYLQGMGYTEFDYIECERCKRPACDIHHINPRGMGGSKKMDFIENLMALCRPCHNRADFGKENYTEEYQQIHNEYMKHRSNYLDRIEKASQLFNAKK
jgi:5-methylcytosine-specific restriction endonuclease McrA